MTAMRYIVGIILIAVGLAALLRDSWWPEAEYAEFGKTWTYETADLRHLAISSDYALNITFVRSEDGRNSIELTGRGTNKMISRLGDTAIANQALSLDLSVMPDEWYQHVDFWNRRQPQQLVIRVAEGAAFDSFILKLDSGNVGITDAALADIGVAEVNIDSGNVTLTRFKSSRLDIDIDSGNLTGEALETAITATADSGNIRVNGITGSARLSADSGNIEVRDMRGPAALSADSGNIRLFRLDNANTDIIADSGNVYVQVPYSFAGFYDLRADSGNIRSPDTEREPRNQREPRNYTPDPPTAPLAPEAPGTGRETTDYVKVRTDSGNITIEKANG